MANHALNKTALQNLVARANAKTNKNDSTITDAIASLEAGYGQSGSSECTGEHVIQVEELPTENIDVNAVYKARDEKCTDVGIYDSDGKYMSIVALLEAFTGVPVTIYSVDTLESVKEPMPSPLFWYYCRSDQQLYSWNEEDQAWDKSDGEDEDSLGKPGWVVNNDYAYYQWDDVGFRDVVVVQDGLQQSYGTMLESEGAECSYNTIPTKTTEGIKETILADAMADSKLHFYYIEDENDIFGYTDPDGTGTKDWYSLSLWLSSEDQANAFQGCVADMAEATQTGYYAIGKKGWQKYMKPCGKVVIAETNKIIDVRDFSSAYVFIEKYSGGKVYS